MDATLLAIVSFLVTLALMAIGLDIGFALGATGIIGFYIFRGNYGLSDTVPFSCLNNFVLTAVPLFIFMGEILVKSGISEMLYRGASKCFSWAPGGLLHSNIATCALFACISGSSPATAATIGTVSYPSLRKRGYDIRLSVGSLAAGGTLGILIPPSINMIVYGMLAETSVGGLFAGGVIPGFMLTVMFMVYIYIRALHNPCVAPREQTFSIKSAISAPKDLWPLLVLMTIILGGIFAGLMTPTEAAAIGSSVALLMVALTKTLTWQVIRDAFVTTIETTAMLLYIVVGASILSSFFAREGIPQGVSSFIVSLNLPIPLVLTLIYMLYLVLGCFIDGISMMVMTVPTILPIVIAIGYDPLWFGVILVILAEIGMLTPPMGLNLFVIHGISKVPISEVAWGSVPFFLIMILMMVILTYWPELILYLPNLIYK